MKDFINILKIVFCKKIYIDGLYEYYGEPQGVYDHLQSMVDNHQFLLVFLRKNIEDLDREIEKWDQYFFENQELSSERQGGCYDCPWGNGEGGCTIPGYCPDISE